MTALPPALALVRREFISQLRHARTFLATGVFVGAVCVAFSLWWPEDNDLGRSGTRLFDALAVSTLGACCLLGPGLACIGISSERNGDTLDMLRMAGFGPRGILAGKLISVAGVFLVMLIAVAPMIGSLFFLTGIDIDRAVLEAAYLGLTLVAVLCVGLACGVRFSRPLSALTASYVVSALVVLPVVTFIVLTVVRYMTRYAPEESVLSILPVSPGLIVLDFERGLRDSQLFKFKEVAYLMLVAGVAWRLACRGVLPPRIAGHPKPGRSRRRIIGIPFYLIDPLKPKTPLENWQNPFLWRELRWGYLGHASAMIRQFYGTLIVFGGALCIIVIVQEFHDQSSIWWLYAAEMSLPVFLALIFSSNLFSGLHATGEFDLLRSTLVPVRGIFFGKVLSVIVRVAPVLAAIAVVQGAFAALTFFIAGWEFVLVVLVATFSIVLNVVFTAALCALAGLYFRTAAASLGAGLFATAFVQLGWSVAFKAYEEWMLRQVARGVWPPSNTFANPDLWAYVLSPGMGYFYLLEEGPHLGARWLWWVGPTAVYGVLTWLLLEVGARTFDRRIMGPG